jgi:hypothetical protein
MSRREHAWLGERRKEIQSGHRRPRIPLRRPAARPSLLVTVPVSASPDVKILAQRTGAPEFELVAGTPRGLSEGTYCLVTAYVPQCLRDARPPSRFGRRGGRRRPKVGTLVVTLVVRCRRFETAPSTRGGGGARACRYRRCSLRRAPPPTSCCADDRLGIRIDNRTERSIAALADRAPVDDAAHRHELRPRSARDRPMAQRLRRGRSERGRRARSRARPCAEDISAATGHLPRRRSRALKARPLRTSTLPRATAFFPPWTSPRPPSRG